jgi:hypothetical protein
MSAVSLADQEIEKPLKNQRLSLAAPLLGDRYCRAENHSHSILNG